MKDWYKQTKTEQINRVMKTLEKGDPLDYNETALLKNMFQDRVDDHMKMSDLIKENERLKGLPKHRPTQSPTCLFCDNTAETENPFHQQVCYKHRRTVSIQPDWDDIIWG